MATIKHTAGQGIEIKVDEHIYTTPPLPPHKEIAYHDRPKADQYWTRQKDIPKAFYDWHPNVIDDADYTTYEGKELISLSREDTNKLKFYQDREIHRMKHGFWFYNNGEPTYLTGDHYFVLQWAQMLDCLNINEPGIPYGSYMEFQRNFAYFIEICEKDPKVSGGNVVKPKKTGITMFMALILLGRAIRHRGKTYRMMSTKQDVAKKINFDYIDYAVERLPPILTPEYRKNLGAIHFENIDSTTKRSGKKRIDVEFMNSAIETIPTIVNGFDSGKNAIAWIDEQSKIIIDSNTLHGLHNTTLPTVYQGFIKIGFVIYTHYVSERNDKSFKESKEIYYNSKLRTRDERGVTKSQMICYAMTSLDGLFGACDKYGKPILKMIWDEINLKQKAAANDPVALRSLKRQMPTCEEDMWQVGAGEASIFDNMRLGVKHGELTKDASFGNYPYELFDFRWEQQPRIDELKSIYVFPAAPRPVFKPYSETETALFKWYRRDWTPQRWLDGKVGKIYKDKKGRLMPNPESPFFAAIDPTQYSNAKDVVTGSKNAIQVFVLPNGELDSMIGQKVSNKRLMAEYLHRPDSPRDTLTHAIQTILYFGCYVLIECNAAWLATRLKECGLANFLIMVNEETNTLEPYREFAKQKFYTSQKNASNDTIGEYILAGMNHYGIPETDMDIDNIENLDSMPVIEQLMEIDPNDTKKYDAAVCHLIGLHGINCYMGWKQKDSNKSSRITGLKNITGLIR